MSNQPFQQSRVLITGASSGIGEALAVELAAAGADLVLVARREKNLDELRKRIQSQSTRKVVCIVGDITEQSVRNRAIEAAQKELGGIDYLINNAGVGATALFESTTEESFRRLMEVNFFSLVSLTQQALPLLRKSANDTLRKQRGIIPTIVMLGSIVGLRGVPHYSAYGATKFAVTGFSESLRAELAEEGINVLLVSPGTTETGFFNSLLQSSSAPNIPVRWKATSESVAKRIIQGIRKRKHHIIPYFPAQLLFGLNRLCPTLVDWMMRRYK